MKHEFAERDKIIWDSHFGYDIGLFIGEGQFYDHYEIQLASGSTAGTNLCVSSSELHPYSKELIETLSKKYGYTKDWSEVF